MSTGGAKDKGGGSTQTHLESNGAKMEVRLTLIRSIKPPGETKGKRKDGHKAKGGGCPLPCP